MRRFFYSHSGIIWNIRFEFDNFDNFDKCVRHFHYCQSCQSCQSVKVSKCQTACSTLKKVEWILSLTL